MEEKELSIEKLLLPTVENQFQLLRITVERNSDLITSLFLLERIRINGRLNSGLKTEMDLLLNKYK